MSASIDLTTCPLLTRQDIGQLCRNLDLAKRGIHHGWLTPAVRTGATKGKLLYTRAEVDRFIARLETGEVPDALPRGGNPDNQ